MTKEIKGCFINRKDYEWEKQDCVKEMLYGSAVCYIPSQNLEFRGTKTATFIQVKQ